MRKFVAVLFLMLCFTSLIYGQKTRYGQHPEEPKTPKVPNASNMPNPADSTIKVHISATHLRSNTEFYADVILNGKKIELSGNAVTVKKHSATINYGLIIPGDYQARLTKDLHNADGTIIRQEYDLLLPDGTIWHCVTSGIYE